MGEANFGQPGAGMMKRGRGGLIAYGIISIAIGMIAFVWPFPATMAVTIFCRCNAHSDWHRGACFGPDRSGA